MKTKQSWTKPNYTVDPQQFVTVHFSQIDKAAVQRAPSYQSLKLCWKTSTVTLSSKPKPTQCFHTSLSNVKEHLLLLLVMLSLIIQH